MRPVRRFLALPTREQWLLVHVAVRLWWVRFVVAVRGVAPYRGHWPAPKNEPTLATPPDLVVPRSHDESWAVSAVQRQLPFTGACLHGAIVVCQLLDRRGLAPQLCLGVRRPPGQSLTAHAWVQVNGRVVHGGEAAQAEYSAMRPTSQHAPAALS
jgi:hypothetical protein